MENNYISIVEEFYCFILENEHLIQYLKCYCGNYFKLKVTSKTCCECICANCGLTLELTEFMKHFIIDNEQLDPYFELSCPNYKIRYNDYFIDINKALSQEQINESTEESQEVCRVDSSKIVIESPLIINLKPNENTIKEIDTEDNGNPMFHNSGACSSLVVNPSGINSSINSVVIKEEDNATIATLSNSDNSSSGYWSLWGYDSDGYPIYARHSCPWKKLRKHAIPVENIPITICSSSSVETLPRMSSLFGHSSPEIETHEDFLLLSSSDDNEIRTSNYPSPVNDYYTNIRHEIDLDYNLYKKYYVVGKNKRKIAGFLKVVKENSSNSICLKAAISINKNIIEMIILKNDADKFINELNNGEFFLNITENFNDALIMGKVSEEIYKKQRKEKIEQVKDWDNNLYLLLINI